MKSNKYKNEIFSSVTLAFENAINSINSQLRQKFPELQEKIKESNELYKKHLTTLARYGWYISPNLDYKGFLKMLVAIKYNRMVEVEKYLVKFYTKNIMDVEKTLSKYHPERKKIITEAFKAHKNRMYFSSINLFLSQADGICNGKLYLLRKNKKELNEFLKDKNQLQLVIDVLGKANAIDTGVGKRVNYFSDLNRHEAIHGLSNNYGNKVNSLKALSLLCFISEFGRYKTK